jgi:uncharacterized protein (UPF0276 family)
MAGVGDESSIRRRRIEGGPTGVGLGLRWAMLDDVLAGDTPSSVSFFEVSPENYMRRGGYFPEVFREIARDHRVISHGLMMNVGNMGGFDDAYMHELRHFLHGMGATHHSDHLCWSAHEGRNTHDLMPLTLARSTIQRVIDNLHRAQDWLGLPISLENISYYASVSPREREGTAGLRERDFLCEVLERADCGLLLDVNNLWVNATNHGFDAFEYLRALPLERVVEVHVAGGQRVPELGDLVIDTHGRSVSEEVEALMEWVVRRTGPIPVLYERDHDVPPLEELGREVEHLQAIYNGALESRVTAEDRQAAPSVDASTSSWPRRVAESPRIVDSRIMEAWGRAIFDSGDEHEVAAQISLERLFDAPESVEALAFEAAGADGIGIYRKLMHRAMRSVVHRFLKRTAAHFGEHFDAEIDAWLAEVGPSSPYLRDVPGEFMQWARSRWEMDPRRPGHLVDLARHELIEFDLGAARIGERASAGDGEVSRLALSLDSQLELCRGAKVMKYDHAVHELEGREGGPSVPVKRPTRLLVYRDEEHDVRYLELSRLAEGLLDELNGHASLENAIAGACAGVGESIDEDNLARVGNLLAELSARGIVRVVQGDPSRA